MTKTILITGATDGIGVETARMLAAQGHTLLLHGRSAAKLEKTETALKSISGAGPIETYVADFSRISEVDGLAKAVAEKHDKLDVLINNAGVYKTSDSTTESGIDVRFVVNTLAPYLLTRCLFPLLGPTSRVVNLSSAAQSPVDLKALAGKEKLSDSAAYAQSKLALTMWSRHLAEEVGGDGPMIVAVNPGSLLATKMVKEAYGTNGADVTIGADILVRAALSDEFADAPGKYFDNDGGRFAKPHPHALNPEIVDAVVKAIEEALS